MAKRKRLMPARLDGLPPGPEEDEMGPPGIETKTMFPRFPDGVARHAPPLPARRPPIADVAGDAAATAAFAEVAQSLAEARAESRFIQRLPLDSVREDYLVRDRVLIDDDEMRALRDSIRARGQQTAIEVADLGQARYGLISGWRRLTALKQLRDEGSGPDTVLAIARPPQDAAAAYLAMVEENEIRVGLSYYERARIVLRAVEKGVYRSDRQALAALFEAASRAKRSKIGSFLRIVRGLDAHLRFPAALGERAGLALAGALERDDGLEARLITALADTPPASAEAEAQLIAAVLAPPRRAPVEGRRMPEDDADSVIEPLPPAAEPLRDGLAVLAHPDGRLTLQGLLLDDPAFRAALLAWLRG